MPLILLGAMRPDMVTKEHVLWFVLGVVFALFLLPMIQQWFESRKRTG